MEDRGKYEAISHVAGAPFHRHSHLSLLWDYLHFAGTRMREIADNAHSAVAISRMSNCFAQISG